MPVSSLIIISSGRRYAFATTSGNVKKRVKKLRKTIVGMEDAELFAEFTIPYRAGMDPNRVRDRATLLAKRLGATSVLTNVIDQSKTVLSRQVVEADIEIMREVKRTLTGQLVLERVEIAG